MIHWSLEEQMHPLCIVLMHGMQLSTGGSSVAWRTCLHFVTLSRKCGEVLG